MDGINALPKWDPSNPLTYRYDPSNYDRADYAKFKQARLDFIKKRDTGKPSLEQAMKNLNRTIKQTIGDKIAEQVGLTKKQPTKSQMQKALANGGELHAVTPSDCFSDLYAIADDDGMVLVTAVFANPTRGEWQYSMSLDDFLDWANDDLGVAFNEWVRGNYEV